MERSTQTPQTPRGVARGRVRGAAPRPKRAASVSIAVKRLDEIARADVALIRSIFDEAGVPEVKGSDFSSKIEVEFFEDDKTS